MTPPFVNAILESRSRFVRAQRLVPNRVALSYPTARAFYRFANGGDGARGCPELSDEAIDDILDRGSSVFGLMVVLVLSDDAGPAFRVWHE